MKAFVLLLLLFSLSVFSKTSNFKSHHKKNDKTQYKKYFKHIVRNFCKNKGKQTRFCKKRFKKVHKKIRDLDQSSRVSHHLFIESVPSDIEGKLKFELTTKKKYSIRKVLYKVYDSNSDLNTKGGFSEINIENEFVYIDTADLEAGKYQVLFKIKTQKKKRR